MIKEKINEENTIVDIIPYIKECFIEFSDELRCTFDYRRNRIKILIDIPDIISNYSRYGYNYNAIIEIYKWKIEEIEQIKCSLQRVKIKYNNVIFYYIDFPEISNIRESKGDSKIEICISKLRVSLKQSLL